MEKFAEFEVNYGKYYSHRLMRSFDPLLDGCIFGKWDECCGKSMFAVHPKGFPVFLSPEELTECDEYREEDPYGVESGLGDSFHETRLKRTLQFVEKLIATDESCPRILDLGCGQGHITGAIQKKWPEAEISGLDYSLSAIEYAHEHFPGISFAVADAYAPPYPDQYFDIVVCNNLWEHVPDPLRLLAAIARVTKVSGHLVLSTPSRYRLRNLCRILTGKPVVFASPHHVTEYSVGQVKEQLRHGGYRLARMAGGAGSRRGFRARFLDLTVKVMLRLCGSHHRLEPTVFYLAEKID